MSLVVRECNKKLSYLCGNYVLGLAIRMIDFEDFPRILTSTKYKLATRQLDWRDEADDLLRMVSYRNKSNYKL